MAIRQILVGLKDSLLSNSGIVRIFGNVGASLILIGFEQLLEQKVPCPCAVGWNYTYALLSFLIPAISLFMISLMLQSDLLKWCRCRFRNDLIAPSCKCNPFKYYFLLMVVLKALIPPIMWISILFLDGDYYACSKLMRKNAAVNSRNCSESQCNQNPGEIPPHLQKVCNESRLFGALVFVISLIVMTVLYFLPQWTCFDCKNDAYYKFQYDYMCEEGENKIIMKKLKNKVEENVEENTEDRINRILPNIGETQREGHSEGIPPPNVGSHQESMPLRSLRQDDE
ncbi:calcium homeostasis modulator protein 6-like isoform X2 [Heptranchias perlo]|uniref:calcium homeostasis modulator protein 6-like isoform X2 n=1 Tax=Heptranchias perlo TaxID=212740 RepID=UPI00355A5882